MGNLGYVSVIARNIYALAPVNTKLFSGGVAATPDGKTVYVATLGGFVVRIDVATSTFAFIAVDDSGNGTSTLEGIAVTPDGKTVYVANQVDGTVWVINTTNNSVSGPIQVGSDPQGVSVTPDGSKVYVANQADGTVSVINTATNTVTGSAIPVGKGPSAFGNFISRSVPTLFAGTPGSTNCNGKSVSALSNQYGNNLRAAATALGFASVSALQNAITGFCNS